MCLPSLVYLSKHRISAWALSGKSSGITIPNEITYFNASSTLISSSRTSLFFHHDVIAAGRIGRGQHIDGKIVVIVRQAAFEFVGNMP